MRRSRASCGILEVSQSGADPGQLGQEIKSLDVGVSAHVRAMLGSWWRGGVGRSRVGWGGSSHSPLLAVDVMLLHRVAEEGSPGAGNDSRFSGIYVEGVCEPWDGEKRVIRQAEVWAPMA